MLFLILLIVMICGVSAPLAVIEMPPDVFERYETSNGESAPDAGNLCYQATLAFLVVVLAFRDAFWFASAQKSVSKKKDLWARSIIQAHVRVNQPTLFLLLLIAMSCGVSAPSIEVIEMPPDVFERYVMFADEESALLDAGNLCYPAALALFLLGLFEAKALRNKKNTAAKKQALKRVKAHRGEISRMLRLLFNNSASDKKRLEIREALRALFRWYCKAREDPTNAGVCDDPVVIKLIQEHKRQEALKHVKAHKSKTSRILRLVFKKSRRKERSEVRKAFRAMDCWYRNAKKDPTNAGVCDDPVVIKYIQVYKQQEDFYNSIGGLVIPQDDDCISARAPSTLGYCMEESNKKQNDYDLNCSINLYGEEHSLNLN